MGLLKSLKTAFEVFKLCQEHGELEVIPVTEDDLEEPVNLWINTSEQLPEPYDSVVVVNPDTSVFMDAFVDDDGDWQGYYYTGLSVSESLKFTPVAWLPVIWRES